MSDIHIQKLEALNKYMDRWIDKYPYYTKMSFEGYCKWYYPHMVEGTPAYYRCIATNCYYCNKQFGKDDATIDHFIPKAKGGRDNLKYNRYVVCCKVCNLAKADIHPFNFLSKLRKAMTFGNRVGDIEKKRLQKVYDSLSQIISDYQFNINIPVYYKVLRNKQAPVFFSLKPTSK
jgi:hypothetical protein